MTAYYNEIDEAAASVLRELIRDDVIAPGDVDTRSIKDVQPDDLRGYDQCHFFAGGGLWSVAARLAKWPDDRPLWTGSCPCQPFSQAGRRLGTGDPRHLWPDFHRLINSRRPPVVLGEQVAGQAGRHWFHGVRADLARSGYASRAVDIPACAVDSPQQRQRLYWLAMADAPGARPHAPSYARVHSLQEGAGARDGEPERLLGANGSWWADAEWITGHDGQIRRAKSGIPLLADGLPGRVDLWRLAGNAISPVLAAEVISAVMDISEPASPGAAMFGVSAPGDADRHG